MTTKEVRALIAESNDPDWFNSREVTFSLPHINFTTTLTGVSTIHEFFKQQLEGWLQKSDNIPDEFQPSKKVAENTLTRIETLLTDTYGRSSTWNEISSEIENRNRKYFIYEAPEVDFLLRIYSTLPEAFIGAYNFLVDNINNSFSDKHKLMGTLLAYEFTLKDQTSILERRNSEKSSLSTLRTRFAEFLSESENGVANYLKDTHEKYKEYASAIDVTKESKEKLFDEWFAVTKEASTQFDENANNKVKELEDLYREKLKLEAPAKYWNQRAKVLRGEGYRWLVGLGICLVITVGILVWILNRTSDGSIHLIFQNTGTAIKWSVVLITLISFLAFAIRTFSKLTFSSFHLVRDAEEREQLTYVYLALQKEKVIDETERHLVMQSLFSRADSGLLKDEASPTMPGNIMDKMLSK